LTTIAVDAMGGDNAPRAVVQGAVRAASDFGANVILVGPEGTIRGLLGRATDRVSIACANETIGFDEPPVQAIRKKKDSTTVVGMQLVKEGKADAFVSAGSTGALLAGGLIILGRIKGIDRPALSVIIPGLSGKPFLMLDVGANTDVRPQNLVEFALMGRVYSERVLGVTNPRVGLINIGSEESKGNELTKQAYGLLKQSAINFAGNVEARDVFAGACDVAVCDGFVGNVLLKNIEGLARAIFAMIKEEVSRDLRSKAGALILKPYLKKVAARMDYSEYGGAPLLGLALPCIKCHGSSGSDAIRNGIGTALRFVESKAQDLIGEALTQETNSSGERN